MLEIPHGTSIPDALRKLEDPGPRPRERIRVFGVRGGAGPYFLWRALRERPRPAVLIAPGSAEAESWLANLRFFFGENASTPPLERRVHWLPAWDVEPLGGVSPTAELVAERLSTLYHLCQSRGPVVVTSPDALLQRVPPRGLLLELATYLVEGEELGLETLAERFDRAGYQRVPQVEDRGEYSVRGGLVDVYPAVVEFPFRLEFFGDVLEAIRTFDPATQRSHDRRSEALVLPWREIPTDVWRDSSSRRAVELRSQDLAVARNERLAALSRMESGLPFPGGEFLAPLCLPEMATVAAYCPEDTVFWLDRPPSIEAAEESFARSVAEHRDAALEAHRIIPPPESLFLEPDEGRALREGFPEVELEPIDAVETGDSGPVIRLGSYVTSGLGLPTPREPGRDVTIRPFVRQVELWRQEGESVRLVTHDRNQARRLQGLLGGYGVDAPVLEGSFPDTSADAPIAILVGPLTAGFRLPAERLTVVTGEEIFGERRKRRPRRIDVQRFLDSMNEIHPGDAIVHVDHGIGLYRGLRHMAVADMEGDYLHLEYQGGDRLYVPVDRINVVEKYVGPDGREPQLDKLGGTSWERVKERARESVFEMAQELLEIHAAREVAEGHHYGPPDPDYREFEARFPFEETEGQQRAIDDVLRDLQSERPMDRLVCGDVGYGKTEVALRAAFRVVMEGRQVAVLVPTTLLARQHHETFRERFAGYPVRIEVLSRFRRGAESERALADLVKGDVDVVVGTHRLLQEDVEFRDLGLLVVDEEHRFGVRHKERIKKLRATVDVLTLTATPIPRTLHMAMSGIRDLSIIDSPPADRQAVRTYVTRYEDKLVREAILREIARGGQVFFVHNRVETIRKVTERLEEQIPEARFGVAHGQMRAAELEKVMIQFIEGKIDVLVTTAIIESGLDIPNANTILIDRADQLGLAQLYQLRGRVGRSHQRAYAYLLVPGEALMTGDAQKRLSVLASLDDLGGGFRLAMHDLEIRGAGNLLGKQQSGQIAAVGFELFTHMLEEAIQELRGGRLRADVEPEIQIGISAFVPDDYIPDVNQRLAMYKRLARVRSAAELQELADEMEDRYGPMPARVQSLIEVMDLRRYLKAALVTRLRRQGTNMVLQFHETARLDPERIVRFVESKRRRGARAVPGGEISFPMHRIDVGGVKEEVQAALRELGAELPPEEEGVEETREPERRKEEVSS